MKKIFVFVLLVMSIMTQLAQAEIPATINYQGRLTNKTGEPVADNTYSVTFSIYDVASSGTHIWRDVYDVQTKNGYFNATIGSGATDLSGLAFDIQYYLGIKVSTEINEMSPRHMLDTSPYAMRARNAIDAASATVAATALAVADNSITSAKIVDGAVGSVDITDGSITSADISDGQVGMADIAANAVMPIGVILPWHKTLYSTLPSNWVECNGGNVNDPTSPISGAVIPNLNGEGRFLRGGTVSGTMQADAMQGHIHRTAAIAAGQWTFPSGGDSSFENKNIDSSGPISDGTHGTPRVDSETRPVNMSVVWIMKIK